MTEPNGNPLMKGSTEYTAFVSYSWTSEEHQQWVLELATRLMADGVNVILDVWDLRPGQDKHAFMEKTVLDEAIRKVLIICDKGYQEKADSREKGVGTETELISAEVYTRVDQEKFIPVIAERYTNGDPFMPRYLGSRVYIDLSQADTFEAEYQRLLRNIYGRPEKMRPPVGEPPAYLFEEPGKRPKSAAVARRPVGKPDVRGDPSAFIEDFFEQFLVDMEAFRFKAVEGEPYDETMMKLIEQMRPLRDSFIEFVSKLARSSLNTEDIDLLHDNLERLGQLQFRPWDVRSYQTTDWDNYRFVCYELMLHLVATLIRYGRFNEMAHIVDATYFYDSTVKRQTYGGVELFNQYVATLEERRKTRLQLRRVSVTADVIRARTEGSGISFDKLVEADLLLHYLTMLLSPKEADFPQSGIWFPHLSPFASHLEGIPLLQRLASRRFFERVKVLFGVATSEELREKIQRALEREAAYRQGVNTFYYEIVPLARAIPIDRLTSAP